MLNEKVTNNFLVNTADSGRFLVTSQRTGRTYFVEPIGNTKTKWGSIDPATGDLMNKKGHDKYRGSVDAEDSLITLENGFNKVTTLDAGVSPHHAIDVLDAKYPDKV